MSISNALPRGRPTTTSPANAKKWLSEEDRVCSKCSELIAIALAGSTQPITPRTTPAILRRSGHDGPQGIPASIRHLTREGIN